MTYLLIFQKLLNVLKNISWINSIVFLNNLGIMLDVEEKKILSLSYVSQYKTTLS